MPINSITEMREAIMSHARQSKLDVQCSCDGAFHSEIAIVAEAPGDNEVQKHRPLVGGSGMKLWEVLRKHGYNRTNVYITNVSKRQVSFGTDDRRHPINKHELALWKSLLLWELSQLPSLTTVVVLGNYALEALTGYTGILNWRGSVLTINMPGPDNKVREVKVVCTVNPAAVLREPKLEVSFVMDCSRIKKVANGEWEQRPVNTIINPSVDDAIDYLNMMENKGGPVAFDIETIGNETACIGFAQGADDAICINLRTLERNRFSTKEESYLRRHIQRFFAKDGLELIAQNGMFDMSWLLYKDRIRVRPLFMDTMLGHHCLYPQLPHNLGYITTQYTTRPYYKNEKDEWREGGAIDDFWRYNGQDCANTWLAAVKIRSELKEQGLWDFFQDHIMRAQPHLVQMVVGGLKMNSELHETLKTEIGQNVLKLLDDFHRAAQAATKEEDYTPNPRSPKQMTELYFTKLRLVGRGTSTDEENRKRMYAHPRTSEEARTMIRAVNAYAEEAKFFSTYVQTAVDDDGRFRCTYNQTGVQSAPGRLSSSGMLWKNAEGQETGGNLQNQPERAHSLYVADEGYALGYFDLSQAEARVVGWYANIIPWIEQFERARIDGSYDAHRALASEMFGIPYDKVPTFDRYDSTKGHVIPDGVKDGSPTVRYIAKRCRHGLNYRMMPDRLATVTGLYIAEAEAAYNKYHRITPQLQQWWASLEREVRDTKQLFNAYGRRLRIMERITPEALESIVAFKPQSTVGDKVVRVIYQSINDPRWPSTARFWLNIHDALIILAPKSLVQRCLSIAKKYAEEPIIINDRPLIIPAETKISYPDKYGYHSWANMKKIDLEAAR